MRRLVTTTPGNVPSALYDRAMDHIRTGDSPADSDSLQGYVKAAVLDFERYTGMAIFSQTRILYLDAWPTDGEIDLRSGPVTAVTSVKYRDADGVEQTVSTDDYFTDLVGEVGRVCLKSSFAYPNLEDDRPFTVYVEFTAGYGTNTTEIPELILAGLLLYAGHLYDHREASSVDDLDAIKDVFFNRYRLNFLGES